MDKYVLTIEQLEQLLEEYSWDVVSELGVHACVKDFIEAYNIKSESYEYSRGWFDGFNDAKEAVDDAFEQLKKA